MTLRKVLISLGLRLAHLLEVLGAVRIARERVEVRRSILRTSIPRTSIERVEEGRVDSKHVEDLSQHLTCTCHMLMAPCAEIPMLSREKSQTSIVCAAVSLPRVSEEGPWPWPRVSFLLVLRQSILLHFTPAPIVAPTGWLYAKEMQGYMTLCAQNKANINAHWVSSSS